MKQTVDEERESSSPISPDEQQLLDRLHSKSVDEQVGAIVGIGKGAFRRLAGEIAPFIRDPNAELRAAAIRTVGFYWKLAEYRDVAAKMWRSDPDHETRSVAMMAWAGYDQNTKSAPTIRQLYQVVCDEYQPDLVRDAAYTGMISVFGVPAAERPRGAMSLNAPIEDGIDWTLVDRIVQESGAIVASEAAKAEVMEIVYGVGAEKDPINGRIVVKLGRDSSVELEHVHGKRRVWCRTWLTSRLLIIRVSNASSSSNTSTACHQAKHRGLTRAPTPVDADARRPGLRGRDRDVDDLIYEWKSA